MNSKVIRFTLVSALSAATLSLGSCALRTLEQANAPTKDAAETPAAPVEESPIAQQDGAEAYYQQLLSQYGQDCAECLQPLELQVRGTPQPSSTERQDNRQLNVLVALDSSGSMAEAVSGGMKLNVAKAAIARFVSQLPNTAQVGLLVYGHEGSNQAADKAASCAGIESIYPLAPLDRTRFDTAMQSSQPTGFTPIARALEQAGRMLPTSDDRQNVVYVVSDGIETCGGDPVAAAQKLHSQADVIVNVIGFDVDSEAQRQLEAVAQAGGGEYLSARSASELDQILNQSRSQIEQTLYQAQNSIDQTSAEAQTSIAATQVSSCVTIKLTQEATRFNSALTALRPDDPNYPYSEAVRAKLEARQTALRDWSDRVQQSYRDQRDVTLDQLEEDLEAVNRQYGQTAP